MKFVNLYQKEWKNSYGTGAQTKKSSGQKKGLLWTYFFTSKEGRWLWKVRLMRQNIFLRARQTELISSMDLLFMLEQAHLETIFYKYIFTRKFAVEMPAKTSVWNYLSCFSKFKQELLFRATYWEVFSIKFLYETNMCKMSHCAKGRHDSDWIQNNVHTLVHCQVTTDPRKWSKDHGGKWWGI